MVNRASVRQQIMKPPGKKKIKKVMGEFKRGTLKSGNSNKKVKNSKQAKAIALSEARKLRKKKRRG
jgi:hypothetical protein